MMYDLEDATPHNNKVRNIIIVILLLIIIIAVVVAVYIKKDNVVLFVAKNENKIEVPVYQKEKTMHEVSINMLPNFNDGVIEKVNNIYSLEEEKTVYLTFDDGPSKTVTPLILDLLKKENIKATFFVLGSRAELNEELIKREYREGHFIANHGYSHMYERIYSDSESVLNEYNRTKDIISNILQNGYDGHLFRFPGGSVGGKYGSLKKEAKKYLEENGVASVDWNALNEDAAGATTKEALLENIVNTVGSKRNVVILMHDAGDKILTYESLQDVINYLREQGYNFKSFYDIMK